MLLLILIVIAVVALAGGGGDGGSGSGGDGSGGSKSAQKDEAPATTPAATSTPASSDEDNSTLIMSDVRMATDENGENSTKVFSPNDTFYCVGNLKNAPDNTKVTALWIADDVEGIDPNTKLKQFSDKGGSGPFRFELSNNGRWPNGKYVVALYLNDAKNPTEALAFEVR